MSKQEKLEICVGYTNEEIFNKMEWKTKRKGKILKEGLFPCFISKKEYTDYFTKRFIKETD